MNFCEYLLKDKKGLKKRIFVNKDYTYLQLLKDVNLISKSLKKFKRQLISISFDNSYEFIIYYLAIIKSNNIALILEKGLPLNRHLEIIEKYKVNIFFTDFFIDKDNFNKNYEIVPEIFNLGGILQFNLFSFDNKKEFDPRYCGF